MKASNFTIVDRDKVELFVYKWEPESGKPRGVVMIVHGAVEHAGRYHETAERLTSAGFVCYADDHRGHGKTAGSVERLGILGPGGWESVVLDLKLVADRAVAENPGLPLFFLGHSWGSYLGQDFIERWGSMLAGAVLVGTTGRQSFVIRGLGPLLARALLVLEGPWARSALVEATSFGAFNKAYRPSRTGSDFDWTNRNEADVRAALADHYCCFRLTNRMALDWVIGIRKIWREENERKIPPSLPLLILSGSEDASNRNLEDLKPLVARYRDKYGIKDLSVTYYEGARHNLLSETNKEEVFADLVAWLGARAKQGPMARRSGLE